ncbi:transaminase [Ameyamaea chiangmaiensis NBRC 103196]|uniref:Aminotransferase n=1 Tax=Ameyamaea chiangmaiensis TaxID=442969 RepID=A0A850PF60_9PROT|nr:aminotransferase [Ameyamaea chiangmaiensis]MBS4074664.1 aminotransferase [Ameyamaea chiangmaiensis]NVN40886.1 aminotransferase [Ameyamaea chiangmaiensis]GBQ62288.1 transaminase [Ameyamaea chiangmaiensis NBRC 103196]
MKPLNHQLTALPTTIFTRMSALAQEHGAINLGQGFPDTEGPADMIDAACDALRDDRNQYAPLTGLPELRAAVAASNARFYGLEIDPAREVIVTSGATEALASCLMAVLNPGDEVVLIEPLYDTYLPMVQMLGCTARCVRLVPPNWDLPRYTLAAAFGPRTKAIMLNSPMNPTGKVFTPDELAFIAGLLRQHGAYAICDEVYEHLTFDGQVHVPLMTLPGMREHCLRIGSAGKTFSLTGWKIGYITAPASLAPTVAKAHQNIAFASAPNLQRAVAHGLSNDESYFASLADALGRQRDILAEGLRACRFEVLPCSGTYFVVADFAPLGFSGSDLAFCEHITRDAGVTAIPVSAFYAPDSADDAPTTLIRFAFCKRPDVLRDAVTRLTRHFAGT